MIQNDNIIVLEIYYQMGEFFMAERRMFAKTIIDSDAFIDMPLSTQALYFHLSMRADDDGFINNPKKIQRMIGCGDDDLKLLVAKNFIIPFESGIVVIKHWKIHNYIRNDRYKPTIYQEEKSILAEKENKSYTLGLPPGIPTDIPTVDPGKDRIELGKVSIEKDKKEKKESKKDSNYVTIINELVTDEDIKEALYEFIKMRKLIKKPMTDRALRQLINKLYTLSTNKEEQLQILDNSIINNWSSLYPLKNENNNKGYKRTEVVPDWFKKENNITPLDDNDLAELEAFTDGLEPFEVRKQALQERLRSKYGKNASETIIN